MQYTGALGSRISPPVFSQLFKEQSKDVQKEWIAFINRIDAEWREALRKVVRSSLLVRRHSRELAVTLELESSQHYCTT